MLIRFVGLKCSHLVQGGYQYNLFDDTAEQIRLYQAMDSIRKQFGKNAVSRAAGTGYRDFGLNPFQGNSS